MLFSDFLYTFAPKIQKIIVPIFIYKSIWKRMKRFILSENGLKNIINESYGDKVMLVKDYLDKNFMRAALEKGGKNIAIFVKLNNSLPTDVSYWEQDVLDILERDFLDLISDKKERDGFLKQALTDWYYNKISKFGSLSNYDFLTKRLDDVTQSHIPSSDSE